MISEKSAAGFVARIMGEVKGDEMKGGVMWMSGMEGGFEYTGVGMGISR
jgi:hypothetical protein